MTELMKRQIRELLNQIEDCSDKSLAMHCITDRSEFRGLSAVMRLMLSLMAKGQMDEFVIHVAEFARDQRKRGSATADLLKDIQNTRGFNQQTKFKQSYQKGCLIGLLSLYLNKLKR